MRDRSVAGKAVHARTAAALFRNRSRTASHMSRLQILAAQPRMAAGALVTLLLAAGAVVGSGADFTASSANPANTFATGTLSMDNSRAGSAVLSASGLKP